MAMLSALVILEIHGPLLLYESTIGASYTVLPFARLVTSKVSTWITWILLFTHNFETRRYCSVLSDPNNTT
ncbi:hypothetical protein DL93DRAFT_2084583 [Clavulina sp. PMI_390]|nr:hypothetical protein DL93DRAFT_2084583 [Clavulina sp. PMI_390]